MTEAVSAVDRLTSADLLRVVVDTALSAVVLMGEDGRISGWGARAEQTFGWKREEALGQVLCDLIVPAQYRRAHQDGLRRFRETGEGPVLGTVREVSALHREQGEFPVELRIAPAARIDGDTIFIAFALDISERIRARSELEQALEEVRDAKQAMDDFVSALVHELRQPLTVAHGYVSLAREATSGDPEQQLGIVEKKLEEANRMVGDVLLAARLAGGRQVTRCAPVDLGELADDAAARMRSAVELAGGSINLRRPDDPVTVMADAVATGTILDNLVSNALRYADSAPVVQLEVVSDGSVAVVDNARGIPEPMRERIFERFVRGHDDRTGTGLGLFISRELAVQQDGTLELEDSEPGRGSTFRLRLKLTESPVSGGRSRRR